MVVGRVAVGSAVVGRVVVGRVVVGRVVVGRMVVGRVVVGRLVVDRVVVCWVMLSQPRAHSIMIATHHRENRGEGVSLPSWHNGSFKWSPRPGRVLSGRVASHRFLFCS